MLSIIIRFIILLVLFIPKLASAVMPMVSAGGNHTVALKSNGTVVAWGRDDYGQLGIPMSKCTQYFCPKGLLPIVVPGLSGIVAVSAGEHHTVALKSNGTVVAWGNNDSGQLGDGTRIGRYRPVTVPGLNRVVAVSAGGLGGNISHTVALKADGTVVAWGNHTFGQLGLGYNSFVVFGSLRPVTVPRLNGVVAVSAGTDYTMARRSNGTVVGFGANAGGELGYYNVGVENYSPKVVPNFYGVVRIDAGNLGTAALISDGRVISWGAYTGDGTSTTRTNPVAVPGLNRVVAVSAGGGQFSQFTVALKSNGTLVAWGLNNNYYGQLGDGTSKNQYRPVPVYGGLNLGTSTTPKR